MIGDAKRHRWRTEQRFVNAAEIVEANPKGDCGLMIREFLAESVPEAGKPAHLHPGRGIEALHV
jgi:hypothetical protein